MVSSWVQKQLSWKKFQSTIFWQIFSPEFCHFLRNLSLQLCTICNPLQFINFLVIFLLELRKSKMISKANDRLFRYLTTTGPLQWISIDGFKVPKNVNILRVLNLELFFCEYVIIGWIQNFPKIHVFKLTQWTHYYEVHAAKQHCPTEMDRAKSSMLIGH